MQNPLSLSCSKAGSSLRLIRKPGCASASISGAGFDLRVLVDNLLAHASEALDLSSFCEADRPMCDCDNLKSGPTTTSNRSSSLSFRTGANNMRWQSHCISIEKPNPHSSDMMIIPANPAHVMLKPLLICAGQLTLMLSCMSTGIEPAIVEVTGIIVASAVCLDVTTWLCISKGVPQADCAS